MAASHREQMQPSCDKTNSTAFEKFKPSL